jgi:hypothetical protein
MYACTYGTSEKRATCAHSMEEQKVFKHKVFGEDSLGTIRPVRRRGESQDSEDGPG